MHKCIYIPKYNLPSLYSVTHRRVFRDDHLILDNRLVFSSLGKPISPALGIPSLPEVLM